MTRVKLFINDVEKTVLNTEVVVEGDRTGDKAVVKLPANMDAQVNDKVNYVQDVIDLDNLELSLGFESHLKDESGKNNNCYGSVKIPVPINLFRFDTDIVDYGRIPSTATLTGTETHVSGKVGTNALSFDGSTYLTLDKETNFDFERTQIFSVAYWKQQTTNAASAATISKTTSLTGSGWLIYSDTSGNEHFVLTNTNGTNQLDVKYAVDTADGVWHHYVWTYDGTSGPSGVKLYFDGVLVSLSTVTTNLAATILNNNNLVIGATGTTNILPASTLLDDLYIFSVLVSAEEAYSLWQLGTILYETGTQGEKALSLDGTYYVTVNNESNFDIEYTNPFSISLWYKGSTSGVAEVLISKKTSTATAGWDIRFSTSNVLRLRMLNTVTTNEILVDAGAVNYRDGAWHHIVVTYSGSSLASGVKFYVDNVLISNVVTTDNLSATILNNIPVTIGAFNNGSNKLTGAVDFIKLYKRVLTQAEVTVLATKRNPFRIMKFGGYITKIDKDNDSKTLQSISFGKILGETDVRGDIYDNKTPEFIIEDLIRQNTDFIYLSEGGLTGVTLTKFVSDGKLIDVVRDLSDLIGKTFFTDSSQIFHLEPIQHLNTGVTFEHGVNCTISVTTKDDTEIVNDLTVLGANLRYQTSETFSGNGSNKVFTLANSPSSVKATVTAVEKTPEVDYTVDISNKTITFVVAPPSASNNVVITYEYEKPLIINGTRQTSINTYGRHSKRLIMPWIKTRTDGVRFVQSYLNRYKEINLKTTIISPGLVSSLSENDLVAVVNSIKNLSAVMVIKSMRWKYPDFITEIQVGAYEFDEIEYDKDIVGKIHDLEGALTEVKELREYESPEEILVIIDAVDIQAQESPLETLAMTDIVDSSERFQATYSKSGTNYSQNDVYTE